MNKKLKFWILVFLILLLLGYWAYLFLSPTVLAVFPSDGEENLKRNSEIIITFSQPMRTDLVDEYLIISPEVEGSISWQEDELIFKPSEPWPEGADIELMVVAGAKSTLGIPLKQNFEWFFSVSRTRLAYLWPLGVGANLYLLDIIRGDSKQVTFSKGLIDFDVDELNSLIYFSALNANGGSDLFVIDYYSEDIDRVLSCEKDFCSNVQIAYSGIQLAFEKTNEDGISSIWLVPVNGDPIQMSQEGQIADTPQWAPNGHLVFYDRTDRAYQFVDQEGNLEYQLENLTGEPGTWSLTGQKFVVHEHFPFSTTNDSDSLKLFTSHLLSLNTFTKQVIDLSGVNNYIEDTEPSFSPDGTWIAFARTELDLEESVIGRPMWIMRSDGTDQQYLTGDPNYRHSALAWHPNGDQIAFLRSSTVLLTEPPEIWLKDVSEGNTFRIVIGGFSPKWTP